MVYYIKLYIHIKWFITCRQNTNNKAIKTNKNAQKLRCKDSDMLRLLKDRNSPSLFNIPKNKCIQVPIYKYGEKQ